MPITQADRLGILYQGIPSSTDSVLIYTVGTGFNNVKNIITFSNNGDASATAEIYLVPTSMSPANLYRYLPPILIPATQAVDVTIPHDLEAGWKIYVKVSVIDQITVMYSAKVVS